MQMKTVLGTALAILGVGISHGVSADEPAARPRPVLPGVQSSGRVQLPNQWSLQPAGRHVALGDFPVNLAVHPSGYWLAALHAGYSEHELVVVDIQSDRPHTVSRVTVPQTFYGLCFSPDGGRLFASGGEQELVHSFAFQNGLLADHRELQIVPTPLTFVPGGIASDREGKRLFAAGTWGHALAVITLAQPRKPALISVGEESYPYACLAEPNGSRVYVSLWKTGAVAVVDPEQQRLVATWPTERHPTELAISPDGKTLYVACANSTRVSVLDTDSGSARETLTCALYPQAPAGNTPNSLCLTPDGKMLLVANADANNIAVFAVGGENREASKPLGFIPTGWYPTSVRYDASSRRIFVANGKGLQSKANPQGPNPLVRRAAPTPEYIASLFRGSLSIIPFPTPSQLANFTRTAYRCSPLRADLSVAGATPEANPIPSRPGAGSPITHCVYIIKENRTYDQVLGDLKEGNGDPNLCLFPAAVTPNHHRLAREFVLLDNFYVEGEVSADGHQWSMGAYATDFVEKVWPLTYRGSLYRKLPEYPSEGAQDALARPAGGYLWDRCAEAGVSYRSYGEWISNGKTPADPGHARVKALEGHFDPHFRGFDLDTPDQKRADRFLEELAQFEKEGQLPRLIILRLPNDHTAGSRVGKPTPTAFVADNDLALGRVVEGLSKSKFWKHLAIFVVEDDAQNGSDHVDAHRTVALAISPYTRRGATDSTLYSTSSLLRTMELVLGLKPMSQFDAAARPMFASFQSVPDERPFAHSVPAADLHETNTRAAWGADLSERLDLTREDAADDLLLNEVIWKAVRGRHSVMPPPVRAAWVLPRVKKDKDDD